MAITWPHKSILEIKKEENGKVVLANTFGFSFSRVALEAINIALANPQVRVSFVFNEVEVAVKPNDSGLDVEKRWLVEVNVEHNKWLASPEGKAEVARRDAYNARVKMAQKRTKEIVSQSKFTFTDDMAQITGWGGKVEQGARDSVIVGLDWLEKHPDKDITKPGDRKALEAVISKHNPNESGASSGAVMYHIERATEKGWDNYVSESRQVAAERTGGRRI